eukprot:scaffold3830_cov324-Prasinococcus_capsulatus_cf.AAC.2
MRAVRSPLEAPTRNLREHTRAHRRRRLAARVRVRQTAPASALALADSGGAAFAPSPGQPAAAGLAAAGLRLTALDLPANLRLGLAHRGARVAVPELAGALLHLIARRGVGLLRRLRLLLRSVHRLRRQEHAAAADTLAAPPLARSACGRARSLGRGQWCDLPAAARARTSPLRTHALSRRRLRECRLLFLLLCRCATPRRPSSGCHPREHAPG